ncbi:MAG: conserved repeat domain protein [Paenibacillus sp.]|nr:conserved repeat domain protein [Paenibacillus sp.]
MPFIQRFVSNTMGAITFTGNTLGLSRQDSSSPRPGTVGAIGAFVTLDLTQKVGSTSPFFPSYPNGTTLNFTFLKNIVRPSKIWPKTNVYLHTP